jgi:peptidyl-prolyl cis-trans isomerase SurA
MKKKLLFIFFLLINTEQLSSQIDNSIIITVGNYPITRLDLEKEMKIITVLSKIRINEENKKQIKDLAVQSLVKRSIKKSEIERLKINQFNKKDVDFQISNISKNLGLEKEDFKIFLQQNNIKYEDISERFEIDLKWNSAIFKLYKNKITLNTIEIEDKINSEVEKVKLSKSVLLSEIQVNVSSENLESTTNNVLSEIKEVGFDKAAIKLSISNSAKDGGNIGWINENKLSMTIYEGIKNLKKGEISKPIILEETMIIILKKDEKNNSFNLENIKNNIVKQEKMKKLEMFSNSHYSDLEKKTNINFL